MNQAKADAQDPAPAPTPATDTTNTADHASAPDMCAANISYVQNDNTVKVTWDVIDKNAKANVYIRHASERDFRKIATIKISDGSYSFVVTRDGTHYLKMEPINAAGKAHGKECVQTLRLKKVKETTIPVAPNNGPEMKILIAILGLTLFGYLAYRRRQYS